MIIWIIGKNSDIFFVVFGGGDYKVEKAYNNHCPEISAEAADGKFRDEISRKPYHKYIYNYSKKTEGEQYKWTK